MFEIMPELVFATVIQTLIATQKNIFQVWIWFIIKNQLINCTIEVWIKKDLDIFL